MFEPLTTCDVAGPLRRGAQALRELARSIPRVAAAVALVAVAAPGVRAEEEESFQRAVINFVDLGGIDDWRADGSDAILIKGRNKSWFRATFFGACIGLQFAETIGFITDSSGALDKFSSILVDGERCWFRTFVKIPDPELEKKRESES